MNALNLRVGQVIYALLTKKMSVVPLQVIEEVTKKTLAGQVVTYKVRMGRGNEKVYDLAQIDGKVYTDIERLKRDMIDNTIKTVGGICAKATKAAHDWYGAAQVTQQLVSDEINDIDHTVESIPRDNETTPDNSMVVELPGGGLARVTMPKATG
jgi:hypothetical protein